MSQDKNLWDQIWSGLGSKYGKNFQLQVPFSSYYWPDPPPGYISYRTYDLFNERPLWSVGNREVGGTGLYEAYGTVIQFAPSFVATPSQQQALADIESDTNAAQTIQQQNKNASMTGFALAQKKAGAQGKTLEYPVWVVESGWAKTFQEDKEKIDALQKRKADLLAKEYPDNKMYIEAYTPPAPSATTTDKAFRKCSINTAEFWKAIYNVPTPNEIIIKMASGGPKLTIPLDSTDSSRAMDGSWDIHSQADDPFFCIYVNDAWKKLDLTEPGGKVTLEVTLDKIDQYPIGIGGWYSADYLAKLRKQDSWATNYSYEKVFGKDGLLPLISTHFIAFMGMTITIKVSAAKFTSCRKLFTESAGVRIGPFSFGGDSEMSQDMFKRSVEDSTFNVTMNDSYPFIVGYLVARADGESLSP